MSWTFPIVRAPVCNEGWSSHCLVMAPSQQAFLLLVTLSHFVRSSAWPLRLILQAPAVQGALQILDNATDLHFEAMDAACWPWTLHAILQTQALGHGLPRRKAPQVKRVTTQPLGDRLTTRPNRVEGFSGNCEFQARQ